MFRYLILTLAGMGLLGPPLLLQPRAAESSPLVLSVQNFLTSEAAGTPENILALLRASQGDQAIARTQWQRPQVQWQRKTENTPGGLPDATETEWGVSWQLPVFEAGALGHLRRAGRNLAEQTYQSDLWEWQQQVQKRYLEVAHLQEVVRARSQTLDSLNELERKLKLRYETGELSGMELVRLQIQTRSQRVALKSSQLDLGRAKAALCSFTGYWPDRNWQAAPLTAPSGNLNGESGWAASVVERHPEVQRLRAELEQLEAEHRLAKRRQLPGITAWYKRSSMDDGYDHWSSSQFGVGLSIPVFNTGRPAAQSLGAKKQALELRLRLLRDSLTGDLKLLFRQADIFRQERKSFEEQVLSLAENLPATAELAYESSVLRLVEILDAENAALEARLIHAELLKNENLAHQHLNLLDRAMAH